MAAAADKKARKHIDERVARRKMEHYASSITQDGLKQVVLWLFAGPRVFFTD
jgi:hypothetical protein